MVKHSPGKPRDIQTYLQLSLREQLEQVILSRGTQKIDLIISSPHARQLARNLSAEDVYLTIMEVGEDDGLALFELTSYQQAQYLYDLEWWDREQLVPEKIITWFSCMFESDEQKFLEWLNNADYETLVAVFQKLIRVHTFDNVDDLSMDAPELYYFTLDNVFFIEFLQPGKENVIKHAMAVIRDYDGELYFSLMQGVPWQLLSDMDEKAAYWHQSRLEEHGFFSFEETVEIYRPLPDTFRQRPVLSDIAPQESPLETRSPRYALASQRKTLLLSRVLMASGYGSWSERVLNEFAGLSHKVLVADALKPSYETLHAVFMKAYGMVNIGLEVLCAEFDRQPEEILKDNFIQNLFRVGFEPIRKLQAAAQSLFSGLDAVQRDFWLSFIDSPHREIVTSLLGGRPTCRIPGKGRTLFQEKHFEEYREIVETSEYLDEVSFLLIFFRDRMSFSADIPEALDSAMSRFLTRELTWHTLMNTMFIHANTGGPLSPSPLDPSLIPKFYSTCLRKDAESDHLILDPEAMSRFESGMMEQGLVRSDELTVFRHLLVQSLTRLIDQFDGIVPDDSILSDSRLFPGLYFRPELE